MTDQQLTNGSELPEVDLIPEGEVVGPRIPGEDHAFDDVGPTAASVTLFLVV